MYPTTTHHTLLCSNEMRTYLMLPRLLFPHYPSQHSLLQVIIVKYDEAWICPHEISISIDLCDCKRFFSEKRGIEISGTQRAGAYLLINLLPMMFYSVTVSANRFVLTAHRRFIDPLWTLVDNICFGSRCLLI